MPKARITANSPWANGASQGAVAIIGKSVQDITKDVADLASKLRDRKLRPFKDDTAGEQKFVNSMVRRCHLSLASGDFAAAHVF